MTNVILTEKEPQLIEQNKSQAVILKFLISMINHGMQYVLNTNDASRWKLGIFIAITKNEASYSAKC